MESNSCHKRMSLYFPQEQVTSDYSDLLLYVSFPWMNKKWLCDDL